MKTRSSVDLSNLDIKDLLLTKTKEDIYYNNYIRNQLPKNNKSTQYHELKKNNNVENNVESNAESNAESNIETNFESAESSKNNAEIESNYESNENDTITWFLFDVEAYSLDKLPNNNNNSINVIPVQIAWTICTYSFEHNNSIQESQEIEQLERLTNIHSLEIPQEIKNKCRLIKQEKKMFYVSESLLLSKYRNLLTNFSSYFSHATLQKHEQNLILSKFPIRPANKILSEMAKDIKKADFITAFNMDWDIKAIDNLCKIATSPSSDQKNQKKRNPLLTKELRKRHVDLMIISYQLFWNQLNPNQSNNLNNEPTQPTAATQSTTTTQPTTTTQSTHYTHSTSATTHNKGKYTVATMHKTLCNNLVLPVEQKHLAEFDVDMELDILTAVLNNFENPDALESYVTKRKKGSLTIPYWNKKRNV